MAERLLEVERLEFGAAGVALTPAVGFGVDRGAILVVLGPNGAGKTTLFRTCLGLLAPLAGAIRWNGRPLAELALRELSRVVAYVPQATDPAFDFSVEQYVMLGRLGRLSGLGTPGREDRAAAASAIERLGLRGLRERALSRVSGGERQLAAIARALAQQTDALILDEPAASLDIANQARVLDLLADLARDGLGVVYSTHDPNHALRAGHQALLMPRAGEPRHGEVGALVEPGTLAAAYGVPIDLARTPSGRIVISAGK